MRCRCTPLFAAATMTAVVLIVASCAQRCPLPFCPGFVWQSVSSEAEVTEAASDQPAINARSVEHRGLSVRVDFQLMRVIC